MKPEITSRSWAMVGALGLVWGATFLFIELALEGVTPFWLAAYRILFATLLTGGIWLARGGKLFLSDARPWGLLALVAGLSTALPFMLLSWGQQFVTSGFAGVSMATVALLVLPLAHFLIPGEQMTLRKGAGFVIGFVGVVVLIGNQALDATGAALEPFGRMACIGGAACYALSSVTMRRLPPVDAFGLTAVTLIFGVVIVLPLAIAIEGPPPLPDTRTIGVLALLGLLPTAGANLLRVLVIRSAGPSFMSLTNYQVPLWSVLLGVIFLNEPLRASLLLAMVLIMGGLALSQWSALKRLFSGA